MLLCVLKGLGSCLFFLLLNRENKQVFQQIRQCQQHMFVELLQWELENQ